MPLSTDVSEWETVEYYEKEGTDEHHFQEDWGVLF